MSQVAVETESGWFTSTTTKKTGLKLESSNLYMLSRRIDDTKTYIYTIDGVTAILTVQPNFLQARIEITNKVYTARRVYQTFFDYLGNLGGVFEIIIFTFVLFMTMHSTVEMDVNMLNYIVLKDQQELMEEPGKLNQVREMKLVRKSTTLRKRIGFKRYTYSQIFCFKYFSWFMKSNKSYQIYLENQRTLKQKLDLKDFVITQGFANTFSSLLMKPYQIKLMSLFEKEAQIKEFLTREDIKIEDAVDKLMEEKHDLEATKIQDKINSGLVEMIENEEGAH